MTEEEKKPGSKPIQTLDIHSSENDDWIKFARPFNALTEIYIHEVLSRFPDDNARSALFQQTDHMNQDEKIAFILARFAEWGVELPYWWQAKEP